MTRHRTPILAGAVLAVTSATVLFAASPARAASTATLVVSGPDIHYIAAAGQTNDLVISRAAVTAAEVYEFNDQVAISSTDPLCFHPDAADATRTWCAVAGPPHITVNAGDGDDTVTHLTDRDAHLAGGTGSDTLTIGGRPGGAGSADGGDGNDLIKSGAGNDAIVGGPGNDTVSFAGGNAAVAATLSGGGRSNEHDTYSGVENLAGGGGDDYLFGDGNPNALDGGTGRCAGRGCVPPSGNDHLYGNGGNDLLVGQAGDDIIYGGDGNDYLLGGDGFSGLYGEAGNDHLIADGTPVSNIVNGGPGFDYCSGGYPADCEA